MLINVECFADCRYYKIQEVQCLFLWNRRNVSIAIIQNKSIESLFGSSHTIFHHREFA